MPVIIHRAAKIFQNSPRFILRGISNNQIHRSLALCSHFTNDSGFQKFTTVISRNISYETSNPKPGKEKVKNDEENAPFDRQDALHVLKKGTTWIFGVCFIYFVFILGPNLNWRGEGSFLDTGKKYRKTEN